MLLRSAFFESPSRGEGVNNIYLARRDVLRARLRDGEREAALAVAAVLAEHDAEAERARLVPPLARHLIHAAAVVVDDGARVGPHGRQHHVHGDAGATLRTRRKDARRVVGAGTETTCARKSVTTTSDATEPVLRTVTVTGTSSHGPTDAGATGSDAAKVVYESPSAKVKMRGAPTASS